VYITKFQKNAVEEVRVETHESQGKEYLNIRVWYEANDKKTGKAEYKPSPKGITLNIELLPELKKAILAAEKAVG
jgi:hypothetical protein